MLLMFLGHGPRAETTQLTHVTVQVIDPSGAQIPEAEILIGKPSDCVHPVHSADRNGMFAVDLSPGSYVLAVRSQGFATYKAVVEIAQSPGQQVTVTLNVGSSCECVVVQDLRPREPARPLPSPSPKRLPQECGNQPMQQTGVPVFSSSHDGVRYGMSLQANHVLQNLPIPLYIWADNTTDKTVELGTCSMFQNRSIAVWSRTAKRTITRRDINDRGLHNVACSCSVDIKVPIAAHSCKPINKLYLDEMYTLDPGVYSVAEHSPNKIRMPRTNGTATLSFQIMR